MKIRELLWDVAFLPPEACIISSDRCLPECQMGCLASCESPVLGMRLATERHQTWNAATDDRMRSRRSKLEIRVKPN
jgi:hypothetical protein